MDTWIINSIILRNARHVEDQWNVTLFREILGMKHRRTDGSANFFEKFMRDDIFTRTNSTWCVEARAMCRISCVTRKNDRRCRRENVQLQSRQRRRQGHRGGLVFLNSVISVSQFGANKPQSIFVRPRTSLALPWDRRFSRPVLQ